MGSPNSWLPNLNPGFGPTPSQGLVFFTDKLVPFLVSAAIFLVVILALIFLIVGGIMWITSGGNKEGLAKAKSAVTYALIGLVLGLASFIILKLLGDFFGFDLLGAPKVARYIGP